jgi:Holliday junction resolvase
MERDTRAPKQLGDFGEGFVTYVLIRKGFEVANVDHVGADLIAEKDKIRFAISVKTRLFKKGSKESREIVIEDSHIHKLTAFAEKFGMDGSVFAQVVCLADEGVIHLFMLPISKIGALKKVKHGYVLNFGRKSLEGLIAKKEIDYSCWANEKIGNKNFSDWLK